MGVRNEQDAPIATAISSASGLTPSWLAALKAIGHITAAVAALFMTSERVMVTSNSRVSTITGWPWAILSISSRASRSAAPLLDMAPATGIRAPSRTITGQSMDS
ncbi:hypothetical protein D3C72_1813590 [compost metagenome]